MKISLRRQELLDAVNKVKSVVPAKSSLPTLSHVLIETIDGQVRLSATDLKVSIECLVDCTVEESGALTVSCQRLASVLSEMPEGILSLQLRESNIVVIECQHIETKLFSMAPDQFPAIRNLDDETPIVLSQAALKKLFSKTMFAVCLDQGRYNLTGLLFEMQRGKLTVVATDGRRMSLCVETDGIPEDADIKVIIPGKMVNELERLLLDEGEVSVYISESQAAFSFGSLRLITALIEGSFPNYEMVVPKKHDKEIVASTSALSEVMRRTRAMTNDKFNSVRFIVSPKMITFRVVTPEVGEHCEELAVEYDGDPVEIAFNPDFILDVLKRIDSEKTSLVLKDATSPGLLKPYSDAPLARYLNVVMPIRI